MKKILCLILSVMCLSLYFIPHKTAFAFTPIDVIHNYDITVSPRDDATLDMTYHINWEVLDDTKEGPLTWVKIGVPNRFVDNIKAISSNIANISYLGEDGAFIRIDFRKKYYKGEVVDFSFSFHQKRIFKKNDKNQITYRFRPGWFDKIKVENLSVKWLKDGAVYTNSNSDDDEYLLWNTSLGFGETVNVDVSYPLEKFPNINLKEDYSKEYENSWLTVLYFGIIAISIGLVIIVIVCRFKSADDGYYAYRGYTGYYYGRARLRIHGVNSKGKTLSTINPTILNSSDGGHSTGGGSSCACACACACAGGGRAGCSRKDFCSTSVDDILLATEKHKKENGLNKTSKCKKNNLINDKKRV